MRKLKISGSYTTDPFDILSEQQRFYQGLYTSINKNMDATANIESFLRDLNIPKLQEKSLQKSALYFWKDFKITKLLRTMEFHLNSIEKFGS